jgi:hypothetical protein
MQTAKQQLGKIWNYERSTDILGIGVGTIYLVIRLG